jgi:hypothetical protein
VELPVEQDVIPLWQGLDGVHDTSAAHATQVAPLQTWLVPQKVPGSAATPVSVQTIAPPIQEAVPLWQGLLVGVQLAPDVQGLQAP